MLHRLKDIWGDDAEEFNPDHFEPQRRDALPPNAYKPFGIGAAGVHRAPVRAAGGDAGARHAPAALRVRRPRELPAQDQGVADHQARRADDHDHVPARDGPGVRRRGRCGHRHDPRTPALAVVPADRHGTPLLVLFGSNLGAVGGHRLADRPRGDGPGLHRHAPPGSTTAVGELPTDGAVVVVTSSYNGQPPDNAAKFCTWVDEPGDLAAGVRYTVFGCGNRDWAATYQAVPTRVDAALEARGATRVYPRGEGDARGDFDAQFEAWYAGLWDALGSALGLDAGATATAGSGPRLSVDLRAAPHGEPDPAVLPRPGGDRAGQPRAHRTCGHPGRPLGAAPRDRPAARHRPTPRATTSGCCRATTYP